MPFSTAADIYDESRSWQWRVLRASLGTTTGSIVQAMFLKRPKVGPAFGDTCDILPDGKVISPVRRYGVWGRPEVVGTVESVRDNIRTLADHCKLSDADREALFEALRKWIRKDYRATSIGEVIRQS